MPLHSLVIQFQLISGGGRLSWTRRGMRADPIPATAAIGIAAGLGYFALAVGATLILLLVLRGMARFDRD